MTDFPFIELPELPTERLILRRMTQADAEDVFAYASDPEVARRTVWEAHETLDDSRAFLRRAEQWYADGFGGPWGLVHRQEQRIIGTCGLILTLHHQRGELGYALGRAWWGQGLMTEAAREVLRYGFETLGLNRIEARCEPENFASERIMQKLGMTHEGTLRQQMLVKGGFQDMRLYSILAREWEAMAQTE